MSMPGFWLGAATGPPTQFLERYILRVTFSQILGISIVGGIFAVFGPPAEFPVKSCLILAFYFVEGKIAHARREENAGKMEILVIGHLGVLAFSQFSAFLLVGGWEFSRKGG
jgi:hypothetical protein